jgi:type IV pilus assembly protein PilN
MIRINLLGVERQKARKAFAFDIGQQITLACSLLLVAAAVGVGWWYWSLTQQAAQLDGDIAAARQQAASLQTVLRDVQQFEAERGQLQQRVALIQQLRSGQSVPVQLLDDISRSLPDMLWLTSLEQKNSDVTIEGRSTTLIALSDFVANLGRNPRLKKPINIVDSQVEAQQGGASNQPGVDVIRFTVRAQLADATPAATAGAAGRGGGRGAAPAPGRGR